MLLAYTDESYSDAHYYQIAFILRSEDCILLDAILEEAMAYSSYFGIDQDVEFHGNKIMSARKGWEPLGNNFRAKLSIFRFIFTRLATIDASILIQGVGVKRLKIDINTQIRNMKSRKSIYLKQ